MRDLERYVKVNRSKAVVAFAQFQSMTAKEKFYKAAHVSWWQKFFQPNKYKNRKFKGRWLNVKEAPEPDVIIWQNQHIGKM